MIKILFSAAAALAIAGTASAAAPTVTPTSYSFTRDGIVYKVKESRFSDYTLLEGRDSFGRQFRFKVAGRQVQGHYDGQPTNFSVAQPLKLASN